LENARKILRAAGKAESLKNPVLLVWGDQPGKVELVPEQSPGERFRYRAGALFGSGPDMAAIIEGDELVLEAETTLVLKGGRPFASLSGRAFLWWHERAFQTEFWRALVDLRRSAPFGIVSREGPPEKADRSENAELAEFLAGLDADFQETRRFPCRTRYDGEIFTVTIGDKGWPLFLAPRQFYKGPHFAQTPNFCVCLRGEVKLTHEEEVRLRDFLALLAPRDETLRSILAMGGGKPPDSWSRGN